MSTTVKTGRKDAGVSDASPAQAGGSGGKDRSPESAARDLKDAVSENAVKAWENVKEAGSRARERAAERLDDLAESSTDVYELGRDCVQEFGSTVEERIRTQPMTAIAVAAGIGFLCGAIWSRR